MPVIGIVVIPNGKHPRVCAVVLEGSVEHPRLVDTFDLRTSSLEPAEQAVDLARHLSAKLAGNDLVGAGIRIAGMTPVARRSKVAFSRAHCEGAMLFVLREALGTPVTIVDPVGAPKMVGVKKAELEELVGSLTSTGANADAVIAALAALAESVSR